MLSPRSRSEARVVMMILLAILAATLTFLGAFSVLELLDP